MNAARHQFKECSGAIGFALTFLALTIQVLLPLLTGIEIAFADRLGLNTTTMCAAMADAAPQGDHGSGAAHHDLQDGCVLCSALAAVQGFTAPAAGTFAPLNVAARIAFTLAPTLARTTHAVATYNARAPPL